MRLKSKRLRKIILMSLGCSCLEVLMPFASVQASCVLNGNTYVCSDESTSQQVITLTNTASNVHINSTYVNPSSVSGNGIYVNSDSNVGNVTIAQESGSKVSGTTSGITLYNEGTGSTDVKISGDVASTASADNAYHAVLVKNYGATTNLTITQTSGSTITGADCGIASWNYGSGATTEIISGSVTGNNYYGIFAYNSGTDLTITQTSGSTITGGSRGIYAKNFGSGVTSINVSGNISGGVGGIVVGNNSASTTSLDITQTSGSTITGGALGGIYT